MKKKKINPSNRLSTIIRFLIDPPADITDIQQRHRTRLLSALLVIIILFGSISGISQLLVVPNFFPTFVAIAGAVAILSIAYILTRTKYYLAGAVITSLTPLLASYAALSINTKDESAFVFMLISVLLSSILLNKKVTVGIALLNLFGLFILPYVQPAWAYPIVAGKISFHIMISALIVIAMWNRDLVEGDRQKELRESELKFRSIFDYSVDAIGVSKNGIHIMVNPAYVRMFGCESADRLMGRSILELIAPSERAKVQENIRRRTAGEDVPVLYETRGLRCDGTEFDMDVRVSTYELGGELYTVPILRDITQRKQMENSLRISEEKFAKAFLASPDVIVLTSIASGHIVEVNDSLPRLSGYTREELIGKTTAELQFWANPADRERYITALKQDGRVRDLEVDFRIKSGEIRQTLLSGEIIELQDGKYILGVIRDITERKRIEEELRISEQKFSKTFRSSPDSVTLSELDSGRLIEVNDGFEKVFGYTREEAIGHTTLSLGLYQFPIDRQKMVQTLREQGSVRNLELKGHHRSGSELTALLSVESIEIGGIPYLITITRDITERKRAEEALRLSEERYRTLAQNLPDSALLLFDQDLRFIIADGPEIKATGFSKGMLEGKILHEAVPREFAQLVEPNMRRTLAGEKFYAELPYEDRIYRYSYVPLRDDSSKITLAMILATNITQLKKTENALKDSQKRLTTAMRATKVGVWEWDIRTNKTYWSDENYRVMGLEPGSIEARYENWAKTVHPDDLPAAESKVNEAINDRSELNIEFRVVWPDGEIRWINDIGNLIFDENNEPIGMYGIQMDITERKKIEAELRESEIRYRALFEESPISIWEEDFSLVKQRIDHLKSQGVTDFRDYFTTHPEEVAEYANLVRVVDVNKAALKIYRAEKKEDMLNSLKNILDGIESLAGFHEELLGIADGKSTMYRESTDRTFTGEPIEVSLSWQVAPGYENTLSRVLVSILDITERKQMQKELEENRQRLAFLLSRSPVVIYSSKASGDFGATFVSENVTNLLGYQPEEFINHPGFWFENVHPEDVANIGRAIEHLNKNDLYSYEYRFRRADGQFVWMRDEMTLIRDESGNPSEIIGSWIDITQMKREEEEREKLINELEAKNSELERFTYTVSHDLKSPLVTINGFLGYLEQDAGSGNMDRMRKDIQRIQAAVFKMQRLLNELIELSRIGRMMNTPEKVPFGEIVDEALTIVHGRVEEHGVAIDIHPDLPVVFGDRPRLIEVLQNLIDNAAKYMGGQPGPRIEIGQRGEENGMPVLFVKDNGIGIEPEYHDRVFGLFSKLDARSEGTGVGLALVKRIVEFHRGRIWVESEAGRGSTFLFTLPTGPEA